MAARRGLLALLSSTSKDYEEVLAYVRSQRMSSKSLRRIVDELGIKHEDDLDEELSVPDLPVWATHWPRQAWSIISSSGVVNPPGH